MAALVTLAISLVALGAVNAGYVYEVPVHARLEALPGAAILNPKRYIWNIAITQAPISYRLTTPTGDVIEFTAPSYINDATKEPLPFGPTLRARAGDELSIRLTNDLVSSEEPNEHASANTYEGPMATNLHTHGLHDAVGVWNQSAATEYTDGDNNFITIPPKMKPEDKAASFTFKVHIPRDHLPGMHWLHPHKHGSTTIQTSTSHAAIIVDDHEFWFPWNRERCSHLWAVIKAAVDVVLDIQLYFFKVAMQGTAQEAFFAINAPNYQTVSNSSNPKNPLCCDGDGYAFSAQNQDLLLVNGGYQPRISLASNTWARWRMLYSGSKGWSTFQVLTPELQPAPECELQLLNKDGIYMIKVPRQVPALVLASGSRLEVLVRCNAPAGRRYILSATNSPDPFNPQGLNVGFATEVFRVVQNTVATIEIGASKAAAQRRAAAKTFTSAQQAKGGTASAASSPSAAVNVNLVSESCTPNRPAYAADLRDEALAKAGYPQSRMKKEVVNFAGTNGAGMNCAVNGQIFTFPDPAPLVMPLGEIVQWSFNAPRFHPMHVHVNPFQVTYMDMEQVQPGTQLTSFYKEGDYYDNLLIPMLGANGPPLQQNNTVLMRFQPGPFSGFSLMHCHYLNHEDLGCMKVVLWQCPGYNDTQPRNGLCPGFKWPVPADLNGYN